MSWTNRLLGSLRKNKLENQLDDELRFHIEMRAQDFVEAGLTTEEARHRAERLFGNPTLLKEMTREIDMIGRVETILQDLRYAARTLRKQPSFALAAVLTLAVGIGANTAVFSAMDATLFRNFPFEEPDQLMRVSLIAPSMFGQPKYDNLVWSYPKYETFRDLQSVFEATALYRAQTSNLSGTDEPEQVRCELVGASYFPILKVKMTLGRTFLPEEDATPGTHFVAVISQGLWQRRFGGDPQIIGKTIKLDLKPYTIVGVLQTGFQGLSGPADVWIPVHTRPAEDLSQRWSHSWELIARLKRGVSAGQAKIAVALLGLRIDAAHPDRTFKGWGAKARTLNEARADTAVRTSLLVLFGAVTFVLLIASANIANLLLARGTLRWRETAVRLAVGASRLRLIRQLLTESFVLGTAGALASLAVAWFGIRFLITMNPVNSVALWRSHSSGLTLLGTSSIQLDGRALFFTFGVAIFTVVLFGLAPALALSRPNLTDALKGADAFAPKLTGAPMLASKSILVVAEIALAVVLLVGAGLMIKSFDRLIANPIGVDPENVLTFLVSVPAAHSETDTATPFFGQLEMRIHSLPGVLSAGMNNCYPLAGGCNATIIWFRDRPSVAEGSEPGVGVYTVSPDYFKTLKIPLLSGRWFKSTDRKAAPKVIVINQTAARTFWPGLDPIGKPIAIGQNDFGDRAEVIGIVGDVRYRGMDHPPEPDVYVSYLQSRQDSLVVFVRTTTSPSALISAIRSEVHALNKDLPVYDVKPLRDRISESTSKARLSAILLMSFSGIALVLAAIGIYGVMSYMVAQRTREIGIRMALGAQGANVRALLLRRGLALTAFGIGIGAAAALVTTRILATMLYQVKPDDPLTFVLMAGLLGLVAMVATYIPARRATRVDPMTVLRAE
jgi:predicted permease